MAEMKVSSKTNPKNAAGALKAVLETNPQIDVVACGHGAVGQAIKAIAITRGLVATKGRDLIVRPGFDTRDLEEGKERTVIVLVVSLQ